MWTPDFWKGALFVVVLLIGSGAIGLLCGIWGHRRWALKHKEYDRLMESLDAERSRRVGD